MNLRIVTEIKPISAHYQNLKQKCYNKNFYIFFQLCMPMKTCHHAICKECVLRCFVCPKHECRSIIDEASFGVLFDQINSNKVTLDLIIITPII